MTEKLFATLDVFQDVAARSAAMNMAIDEALLDTAAVASIRFYRWQSRALSFGYFVKFADVAIHAGKRDLVRRWTGGGIVFHGEDLTYSIVIPSSDPAFAESSMTIYEVIHRALADVLSEIGEHAGIAGGVDLGSRSAGGGATQAGIRDASYNCFAHPVRADVIIDGRKIAGAAQRRTRRGLLQQGSIQNIAVSTDLAQRFACALSVNCSESRINEEMLERARQLARQKYGTDFWLRKR